jgi:hypothetical protein
MSKTLKCVETCIERFRHPFLKMDASINASIQIFMHPFLKMDASINAGA